MIFFLREGVGEKKLFHTSVSSQESCPVCPVRCISLRMQKKHQDTSVSRSYPRGGVLSRGTRNCRPNASPTGNNVVSGG
jgi:aldehyde:ferredoxin oxidoreductase